jgi:hypothetical protein
MEAAAVGDLCATPKGGRHVFVVKAVTSEDSSNITRNGSVTRGSPRTAAPRHFVSASIKLHPQGRVARLMEPELYIKTALLAVLTLALCACGLKTSTDTSTSAFSTAPITTSSVNGAVTYSAGILVVSHRTGSISNCWKTCRVIGKTEPSGPLDLVLTPAGGFKVYVTNIATGHVVSCQVEATDGWATDFKRGECKEVGAATN